MERALLADWNSEPHQQDVGLVLPHGGFHKWDRYHWRLPPVAGTPTLTWPTTSGTILNSAMASCQILDTAICTTAVDSNGNPNFLDVSSTSIQILGGTTPVSYFVAGVYQQINSTLTITNCGTQPCYSTPAGETEFFIFVKQDTSNANPVAADLVITNCVPKFFLHGPVGLFRRKYNLTCSPFSEQVRV